MSRKVQWGSTIAAWAAYVVLALAATWPLGKSLTQALPMGAEGVATVPLFNLWTLWWNVDRAEHGFARYWQAPIFYPAKDTFAFSEPELVTAALAPLVRFSQTPIAAYNFYLLLALVLNGLSAFYLLRCLRVNWLAALFGGAAVETLPFVHWQLGVLQLVPLYGVIWTIHALYRFAEQPSILRSMLLGAAFAMTYHLCAYHGLFLSVLLIPSGLWLLGRRIWDWRTWVKLVPGMAVSMILSAPVLVAQLRVTRENDFTRTRDLVTDLSAEPGDYTVSPWPQLLRLRDASLGERRRYWFLSPGFLKMLLACCGAFAAMLHPPWRRWAAFSITFTIAALVLSWGLYFTIGERHPYELLIRYYPGFAQIRNVFRFALFVQLMVALLAGIGLDALCFGCLGGCLKRFSNRGRSTLGEDALSRPPAAAERPPQIAEATDIADATNPRGVWTAILSYSALVALGACTAFEVWPQPQRLYVPPPYAENERWLNWVRENTPEDAAVACVPFPTGRNVEDYLDTTRWMYWGTFHRRPLANGYSGFFPDTFLTLKDSMLGFPSPQSLRDLRANGVRYCIVRRSVVPHAAVDFHPIAASALRRLFSDDIAGIDVYSLVPEGG